MIRTSHYLFAALCLGSLFACSRQFTDSYIVPKWCFAVFMLFIVLAYEAVNILFYRQNEQKDTRISVYGFIIVISCFLQAMFGVVQFFGFFQISTTLWVTGSFDNPAGSACCICAATCSSVTGSLFFPLYQIASINKIIASTPAAITAAHCISFLTACRFRFLISRLAFLYHCSPATPFYPRSHKRYFHISFVKFVVVIISPI